MSDVVPINGRPTKYKVQYCEEIITFFDQEPYSVVEDDDGNVMVSANGKPVFKACPLPTFEHFAQSIGVHVDTLHEWADKHPKFSESKKRASQCQKNILIQNGLTGGYNNTFSIFIAKSCLGMRDGNEVDQGVAKPLVINFEVADGRTRPESET